MGKSLKVILMVALSLVLVTGVALTACGNDDERKPLKDLSFSLSQYLKGTTVDMDDATLNSMAEPGGEGGAKTMFMATTPGVAGMVPRGKLYDDMTVEQQDLVQAALAAFFTSIDDAIADGGALTDNPAYVMLHGLSGMQWFGKWAADGWTPADAFWATWPDPAGRGGQTEYMDFLAMAAYGTSYAESTATERAAIDEDLTDFLDTMQAEVNIAFAAAVAAGAAAGDAAFTAELEDNWPDAYAAAGAAAGAVIVGGGTAAEAQTAFETELYVNWSDALAAATAAATVAGTVAATPAMIGSTMTSEAFGLLMGLGLPAAEGWKTDVGNGVHTRQAFYRWMAKGAVSAMAAAGTLIQLSVGEFAIKITNPNDYLVSIDSMAVNVSSNVNGFYMADLDVDAGKMSLGDRIWIPANDSITLNLSVPIKTLNIITWMVMAGYDGTIGGTYATDLWMRLQAGTAVWDLTLEMGISSDTEDITQTETLTWTP